MHTSQKSALKAKRRLIILATIALMIAIILMSGIYIMFDVSVRHSTRIENIQNIMLFYGRGRVASNTLIGYGLSIGAVAYFFIFIKKPTSLFWQMFLKTGAIALLLPPSVFITKSELYGFAHLLTPQQFDIMMPDVIILPA